jgi:hypothetical protein
MTQDGPRRRGGLFGRAPGIVAVVEDRRRPVTALLAVRVDQDDVGPIGGHPEPGFAREIRRPEDGA